MFHTCSGNCRTLEKHFDSIINEIRLDLEKYGRLQGEMTKREGGVRWVRIREKPGKTGELAGMINKSIILLTTLYCLERTSAHTEGERGRCLADSVREDGRSQHWL